VRIEPVLNLSLEIGPAPGTVDATTADFQQHLVHLRDGSERSKYSNRSRRMGVEPAVVGHRNAGPERDLQRQILLQEAVSLNAGF
jgi:hypothetical protein